MDFVGDLLFLDLAYDHSMSGSQSTCAFLQKWYSECCDGNWEHSYGVTIVTTDNPGWSVRIDLLGTNVDLDLFQPFGPVGPTSEEEWFEVGLSPDRTQFWGVGGPLMLDAILSFFFDRVNLKLADHEREGRD